MLSRGWSIPNGRVRFEMGSVPTRDTDLSVYWVSLAAMRNAIQETTARPIATIVALTT
jgi:hypothetical protein